jgi:hypothetical protein
MRKMPTSERWLMKDARPKLQDTESTSPEQSEFSFLNENRFGESLSEPPNHIVTSGRLAISTSESFSGVGFSANENPSSHWRLYCQESDGFALVRMFNLHRFGPDRLGHKNVNGGQLRANRLR